MHDGVPARLAAWLAPRLDAAGPVAIDQWRRHAEGFSWQTFTFRARWRDRAGDEHAHGFAVRREPEDGVLAPYDVAAQYALHERLASDGAVPVPAPRWLEPDPSPLGMPFYMMDRVEGSVPVPWEPSGGVLGDEAGRRTVGLAFVDALARTHSVSLAPPLPSLWRPSEPECVAAETVELWYGIYEASARTRLPLLEEAVGWLRANPRTSGRLALCHGDYRVGNVMVDDRLRISAVLDWELAHIGDPVQDIAWAALGLFRGRSPRWSHMLEGPEFLARYLERTGITVDPAVFAFWTGVNYVKAIANYLRATRAFEEGRAGDLRLAAMGHQVDYLLRLLRDHLRAEGVR